MDEQDKRYIKIKLDDALVKATDSMGEEKLRLCVKVKDHEIMCRFPTYGGWDFYIKDLAQLMLLLAQTAQDIEVDIEQVPEKYFPQWAFVMSQVLRYKECKMLIEKIYFEHLRPEIDPPVENVKDWCADNMDISHLFYMFVSIMFIEDWLKKKSIEILRATFPSLIQPSSRDTSPKNSMFEQTSLTAGQVYEFD